MFNQTFVDGMGKTNRAYTILLSFAMQSAFSFILGIIPLIYFDALPVARLSAAMFVAPPPPPPPAPPPPPHAAKAVRIQPKRIAMDRLVAPRAVPKEIRMVVEESEPISTGVPGGIGSDSLSGPLSNIIGSFSAPTPPPPPLPKPNPPAAPVRIGGTVQQANLLVHLQPVYPPLARAARVQGTVKLEAKISKEGRIEDLKLISGPPLLVKAAMDAVQQWVYKPTLLNNDPVEVLTTIDVNFTLGN